MPSRPEVRIALFGMKGAGKTTLLASYFGNQQRNAFEERHGYRLEAADAAQGSLLLSRYYRLEGGDFPIGTDGFDTLRFGLKVHELAMPSLDVVWYDYPGGWWETAPSDEAERDARRKALELLLDSHAAILLIDSERYLDQGLTYVRSLLDQFRAEIRRIVVETGVLSKKLEQIDLYRVAEKTGRGRVWGTLATTLDVMRGLTEAIDKLDDFLLPKYRVLTVLLKALRTKEGLSVSAEKLRARQKSAANRGKALDAAAYALRAELASPDTERSYFKTRFTDV